MHEDDPMRPSGHKGRIRADMWTEALARHEAGRLRVTELRSSDYFGPGTTARTSYLNDVVIDALLAGRTPFVPAGRADAAHSWTYVPDVGRLAARVATGDDGWGRAWHVPTSPARTFDEAAGDIARVAGVRPRRVRVLPRPLGTAAGLVVPFMRELRETRHQFERPFVLDSDLTQRTFGLEPTPWDEALTTTIAARRGPRLRSRTTRPRRPDADARPTAYAIGPLSGPARASVGLLADPVGQLGDLVVDGAPLTHELADLAVGVHDGRVVATAEVLADLGQAAGRSSRGRGTSRSGGP